jgi:hypothetical protein
MVVRFFAHGSVDNVDAPYQSAWHAAVCLKHGAGFVREDLAAPATAGDDGGERGDAICLLS